MISIIICTINKKLLNNISQNINRTVGVPYEIIAINNTDNQYSITKAYNYGAAKAQYPYLCFIHEDIFFHTDNWGIKLVNHLQNPHISLVGILGSVIKTKAPSGVYISIPYLNRINQIQKKRDGGTDHYYTNPLDEVYSEVKTLDGMFLATTVSSFLKYPFDEKLFTDFHGYDIDFSLGQAINGKVVVIYDILIEHSSYGSYTIKWINEQLKITDKWQHLLPQHFVLPNNEVINAEIKNLESFLISLFISNYKKQIQLKYLVALFTLRPFGFKNFYFLRKFLIYGRLEKLIKNRIKNHFQSA